MAPTSFPACGGPTSTPNTVVGCSWSPRSLTDGAFDRLQLVNRCGAKSPRSELDMATYRAPNRPVDRVQEPGQGTTHRADGDFEEVGGVSSLYSARSMHI